MRAGEISVVTLDHPTRCRLPGMEAQICAPRTWRLDAAVQESEASRRELAGPRTGRDDNDSAADYCHTLGGREESKRGTLRRRGACMLIL
jgi:hypothetical protein